MKSDEIFEKVFCSEIKELILNDRERALARFVYGTAVKEISANRKDTEDSNANATDRKVDLNKKIDEAVKIFKRVTDLFKASKAARSVFFDNFDSWFSSRNNTIRSLKKLAAVIQADKFNCDVSKVVGSSVGVAGGLALGLSFIPFLAPITVPLVVGGAIASTAGAGVVVGTNATEIELLKKNLKEAQDLIREEESSSSKMNDWFNHTKEMIETIESLIESSLIKEMCEDLTRFQDEIKKKTSLTVDELLNRFNQLMKSFIGKLLKSSRRIVEFGEVIAPIVITFVIVICMLRQHNRVVLYGICQMYRFMAKQLNLSDVDVAAGVIVLGILRNLTGIWRIFGAFNVALDVLTMVQSSIDIHNRTEVAQAKQIREAAEKMEKDCPLMKGVYDEVKKWRLTD